MIFGIKKRNSYAELSISYLVWLFHQVYQTGFIVAAGVQTVQIARMDILGVQSSISRQISVPLAFAKGSKFFLARMFG